MANDLKAVNADAHYSDDDLKFIWSIGHNTQAEARAAGQLRGTPVGTGWLYSGVEVERYFKLLDEESGQPADSSTARQAARRGAAVVAPVRSSSTPQGATMSTTSTQKERDTRTIQIFYNAVRMEMLQTGCDRRTAAKRVSQQNPDSHREYLKATNRGRPVANTI